MKQKTYPLTYRLNGRVIGKVVVILKDEKDQILIDYCLMSSGYTEGKDGELDLDTFILTPKRIFEKGEL